jgi:hypothetical protein
LSPCRKLRFPVDDKSVSQDLAASTLNMSHLFAVDRNLLTAVGVEHIYAHTPLLVMVNLGGVANPAQNIRSNTLSGRRLHVVVGDSHYGPTAFPDQ